MRHPVRPGSLIVVGGHSRGVGKTRLVEQIVRANPAVEWACVKLSAHRHAAPGALVPLIERTRLADAETQTGRYLRAGAARAFLVRAPDAALARAAAFIDALRATGSHVIVESNRIVRYLTPDRLFFVIDPRIDDWKASSGDCLRSLHVLLLRHTAGGFSHDCHVDIRSAALGNRAAARDHSVHRGALPRAAQDGAAAADCAR